MEQRITFKDFFEQSKRSLLEVAKTTDPVVDINYVVVTYNKLPVMNEDDQRVVLKFKPNIRICVKWLIKEQHEPVCISLSYDGETYNAVWKDTKMCQWIEKNARKL